MAGPLQGIRVVELPAIGPVPFLGMLLADLGAEVIRVLKPAGRRNVLEEAFVGAPLGRGRRNVELDLRKPGADEVVLTLVEGADIVLDGFRPGVAERLGIGPEAALARNAKLVYGRLTGWGQNGPLSDTAGHDITYLAISGLLHGIGGKDAPVPPVNYVADFAGGSLTLGLGLLAAVLHARDTGEGQVLDCSMVEGAAYLGSMTNAFFGVGLWKDERAANMLDGGTPNYRCYETSDGRFVAIGPLEPQFWAALCEAVGTTAEAAPSPYDPGQFEACAAWLAGIFRTRTRDEWAALFAATDACVAPVLTLAEAPEHPHNKARGSFGVSAGVTVPMPAPRFSATPGGIAAAASAPHETEAVLGELGYGAEALAALRDSGALA